MSLGKRISSYFGKDSSNSLAPMSPQELVTNLCLSSSPLIDELHKTALRALDNEQRREATLDAKSTALLSASGLSVTISFTFASNVLLAHPEYFNGLGRWWNIFSICAYGIALSCGLFAGLFALRAHNVRKDYRTIDERDIFNKDQLFEADQKEAALSIYQRYIILHYWQIYQANFSILEKRAAIIKKGQNCFLAFLMFLAPVAVMLLVSVHNINNSFEKRSALTVPIISSSTLPVDTRSIGVPSMPKGQRPSVPHAPPPSPPVQERPLPTSIPSGGIPFQKSDQPATARPFPTRIPGGGGGESKH